MASNDWEHHKDTITCLYLLEKLSLQDVSNRMKERYNFDKKKHQYEYQLKQWGIKKNIQNDDWRYISHRVQKRRKAGKQSTVTVLGIPLPPEKVQREIQRYTTIPTAIDFGRDAPSPPNPTPDIVRIVTPTPLKHKSQWPENLPWLKFMQDFDLSSLQMPDMPELFAAVRSVSSTQVISRNPLAIYAEIMDLVRSLPQSCGADDGDEGAMFWTGGPGAVASASIKLILFLLANKEVDQIPLFGRLPLEERDRFILWLLKSIIPKDEHLWSARFFGVKSPTTNAILEAVYGCAIRQRKYDLIKQLIRVGVDPNIPITKPHDKGYLGYNSLRLQRGKMELCLWIEYSTFTVSALEMALVNHDTHLATILLEGGANINTCKPSALEKIAFKLNEVHALHLAQLLLRPHPELDVLPSLGTAIAKQHNQLATLLIDTLHHSAKSEQLITHNFEVRYGSYGGGSYWSAECFQLLKIDCTLLHIAIVSGNTPMADILLSATLDARGIVSTKALRDLFMVASLAGDRNTIEHLITLDMSWDGYWALELSPLGASAWNPDIEVTEMILQAGAFSEHDIDGLAETSRTPLPIHVATRSGNTDLVRWLIGNGMCGDSQFRPPQNRMPSIWHWLVPSRLATPFQLALESGCLATISQCRHSKLIGGELIQVIKLGDDGLISDMLSRGADINFVDPYGDSILEAATEAQNHNIIEHYFAHGGKYRSSALLKAVKAALVSQDTSTMRLLATHRPIKIIDRYESSALVVAVKQECLTVVTFLLDDKFLPGSVRSFYSADQLWGDIIPSREDLFSYPDQCFTPLDAASSYGNKDIIERFHKAGYTPPPQDTRHLLINYVLLNDANQVRECITCINSLEFYIGSRTPLQTAVEKGNLKLVRILIDAGADADAPAARIQGASALQLAAILGDLTLAKFLLDRGVNVNAPAAQLEGRTALEGASEHGKLDMVQLLLENGVTLEGAMRIQYIRAVAYANHEGHHAVAKLMQSFGGWTDRDKETGDRKDILRDDGYFLFSEETQDWQFRRVQKVWRRFYTHRHHAAHQNLREVLENLSDDGHETCWTDDGDYDDPAKFDPRKHEDYLNSREAKHEYYWNDEIEWTSGESDESSEAHYGAAQRAEAMCPDVEEYFNVQRGDSGGQQNDGEQFMQESSNIHEQQMLEGISDNMGLLPMERFLNWDM